MRTPIVLLLPFLTTSVLGGQGLHLVSACPTGSHKINSIRDCGEDGCGSHVADALLNTHKNRFDEPSGSPDIFLISDMLSIFEPTDWLTGQDRDDIADMEGSPVRLMAYLKTVRPERGETCNCELGHRVDSDLHLVMVDRKSDDDADSITAEITPRVRLYDHHPDWTYVNVKTLQGKFVRLTGWLMLDTAHIPHSHRLPGEGVFGPAGNRASNWEVHPVTRLEVCRSTLANCRMGVGWKDATFPKKPHT